MVSLLKHRLLWRILVLGVLTTCLSILSHSSVNNSLSTNPPTPSPVQAQSPRVSAPAQLGTPLVITSPRIISWDGEYLEVALDLINVSSKPIRAYGIKQALEGEESHSRQVIFTSLNLTNRSALKPNQLTTTFDVYQATSTKEDHVVFSVDYVEFSDGTKWGVDSAKFADRSAGQRAGAYILSKRLMKILNASNADDVMKAIDAGFAMIEPPSAYSDVWKAGFRDGCTSVAAQLKRAHRSGSVSQVDHELRAFAKRFKSAK